MENLQIELRRCVSLLVDKREKLRGDLMVLLIVFPYLMRDPVIKENVRRVLDQDDILVLRRAWKEKENVENLAQIVAACGLSGNLVYYTPKHPTDPEREVKELLKGITDATATISSASVLLDVLGGDMENAVRNAEKTARLLRKQVKENT